MLPYHGNKTVIAGDICKWLNYKFPNKTHFFDLFGGGGSITQQAVKHFKNVHYNEYLPHIHLAIQSMLNGTALEILPKSRWISRNEFLDIKNSEPSAFKGLVLTCWSFGNNQADYIYGKDVEEWKKALHDICFSNEIEKDFEILEKRVFDGYSIKFGNPQILEKLSFGSERRYALKHCVVNRIGIERFDLQSLESLERLQCLQSLERLVATSNLSYEEVEISNPNSILYCDIPYDTAQKKGNYLGSFDHEKFYDWARNNQNTVVFSEYIENVPNDFEIIWQKKKRNLISATNNKKISIEVLAWNKK